jgi:hypothetical protein
MSDNVLLYEVHRSPRGQAAYDDERADDGQNLAFGNIWLS